VADLLGDNYCLTRWERGAPDLRVRSKQPLSSKDLNKIQRDVTDLLEKAGVESDELKRLTLVLEGRSDEPNTASGSAPARGGLRSTVTLPLYEGEDLVGLLHVGSFTERAFDRSQIATLRQIGSSTTDALRALWLLVAAQRDAFEVLLQNLQDGVVLCDWAKRVQFANQAAKSYLGLEDLSSLRQAQRYDLSQMLDEALSQGLHTLSKIIRLDGPTPVILGVTLRHARDAKDREAGWMIILRDVTASWEADKLKDDLISVVSHEVHTPLASMKDAVTLLLDGTAGPLNDTQKRALEILAEDIERLRKLVSNLLDLSRLDAGRGKLERRNKVRIDMTVDQVLKSFSAAAQKKNLRIARCVPTDLPPVPGNRDRVAQVWLNLLDNAIKFTPPGGNIEVGATESESEITCWVKDTGIGIPEEEQERIFQRFVQLEGLGEGGFGLGLSIAKGIVESAGGRIWVESRLGSGSTFYFTLRK